MDARSHLAFTPFEQDLHVLVMNCVRADQAQIRAQVGASFIVWTPSARSTKVLFSNAFFNRQEHPEMSFSKFPPNMRLRAKPLGDQS